MLGQGSFVSRMLGFGVAVLAALNSAMQFSLVHVTAPHTWFIENYFFRGLVMLPIGLLACLVFQVNPMPFGSKPQPMMVIVQSFMMALSSLLLYFGATVLPVVEAQAIYATNPFWSSVLARVFLGEVLSPVDISTIVASFVCTILILSPWDKAAMLDWRGAGVFVQIAGAVCRSAAIVLVRAISEETCHFLAITTWVGAWCIILAPVAALLCFSADGGLTLLTKSISSACFGIENVAPHSSQAATCTVIVGMLLLVGIISFSSQLSLNRAYQLENPGVSTMLIQSTMIVIQALIGFGLGQKPTVWVGIGVAGVFVCCMISFFVRLYKSQDDVALQPPGRIYTKFPGADAPIRLTPRTPRGGDNVDSDSLEDRDNDGDKDGRA
jgi:drug/metabolite transporter (DMT)-like permease